MPSQGDFASFAAVFVSVFEKNVLLQINSTKYYEAQSQ
jgi:hypothetical protein